jgi:phosphoserine phosphatase RsbU/P
MAICIVFPLAFAVQGRIAHMAAVTDVFLRAQLENRREKLRTPPSGQNAAYVRLLHEVDAALARMQAGSYGICEVCHDSVETDRLLADPLMTVCLDHLSDSQKRDLERDLDLAARIQMALLPPPSIELPGWRLHRHYQPLGPVSGDYCDVISSTSDSGEFLFVLGDVAGKGVAASMLMTQLHAMFRTLATIGLPLPAMMNRANSVFCESTMAGQYATLVSGRATSSGDVELSSAGHPPVLHVSGGRAIPLVSSSLPLGMFCDGDYPTRHVHLAPGESLFLFTDGLSESFTASGAEFGLDRLALSVATHAPKGSEHLIPGCLHDVAGFRDTAPVSDDLSILVVHRAA